MSTRAWLASAPRSRTWVMPPKLPDWLIAKLGSRRSTSAPRALSRLGSMRATGSTGSWVGSRCAVTTRVSISSSAAPKPERARAVESRSRQGNRFLQRMGVLRPSAHTRTDTKVENEPVSGLGSLFRHRLPTPRAQWLGLAGPGWRLLPYRCGGSAGLSPDFPCTRFRPATLAGRGHCTAIQAAPPAQAIAFPNPLIRTASFRRTTGSGCGFRRIRVTLGVLDR